MSIAETGEAGTLRNVIRTIGLSGLGLLAIIVALGDVIARAPAGAAGNMPLVAPDTRFAFGTDAIGRDVLSETVHGLAVTLTDAAFAAVIVIVVGAVAGFAAVRAPSWLGVLLRGQIGRAHV